MIDDTKRETNLYKELIVNNGEKLEPLLAQMEVFYPKQHAKLHIV